MFLKISITFCFTHYWLWNRRHYIVITHQFKKSQKDIDFRWTKKNNETFYGYKNHAKVETKSKFINTYTITDASVYDLQALDNLLTEKDKEQDHYADSAQTGEEQDKIIDKYEMKNKEYEKGYRNSPLTDEQKESNTKKNQSKS